MLLLGFGVALLCLGTAKISIIIKLNIFLCFEVQNLQSPGPGCSKHR